MFGPCFAVQYSVSFLALQSSRWNSLQCVILAFPDHSAIEEDSLDNINGKHWQSLK